MNNDFSAKASGKTATAAGSGSNPFDQIVALEKQENERVAKEIEAMQAEEDQAKQERIKKEEEADQQLKDEAKEALKGYREEELTPILKQAESDAASHVSTLSSAYEKNGKDLAKKLADQMTSADSPLFS